MERPFSTYSQVHKSILRQLSDSHRNSNISLKTVFIISCGKRYFVKKKMLVKTLCAFAYVLLLSVYNGGCFFLCFSPTTAIILLTVITVNRDIKLKVNRLS